MFDVLVQVCLKQAARFFLWTFDLSMRFLFTILTQNNELLTKLWTKGLRMALFNIMEAPTVKSKVIAFRKAFSMVFCPNG